MLQGLRRRPQPAPSGSALGEVACAESAKQELADLVHFLRQPAPYHGLGARLPRGVPLYGPPQAGKGSLARALAREAGVPLQRWHPADGEDRLSALIEALRRAPRQLLYLPELEQVQPAALARLQQLHEAPAAEAPLLVGASSYPELLQAQGAPPQWLERPVLVEYPDRAERLRLLQQQLAAAPTASPLDLQYWAAISSGWSAPGLYRLLNQAALIAGHARRAALDHDCLEQAWRRLTGRPSADAGTSAGVLACHQAGHALIAGLLPHTAPPRRVTILAGHIGYEPQTPAGPETLQQSQLLDRLGVLLGGRVSEALLLGEYSNAAESDLRQAAELAQRMVACWGMGERLGSLSVPPDRERLLSEQTAKLVDDEVRRILNEVEAAVKETLQRHRAQLEQLADLLRREESLSGAEVERRIARAAAAA